MSTTTSPVTHIAEVDVKMQDRKSVGLPVLLEIGSDNKKAPKNIAIKKLPSMVCVELSRNLKCFLLSLFIMFNYSTYSKKIKDREKPRIKGNLKKWIFKVFI